MRADRELVQYLYKKLYTQGRVAEWLGRGLQNLVRRFESVPDLHYLIPLYSIWVKGLFYAYKSTIYLIFR